jgi:hypothetical protein
MTTELVSRRAVVVSWLLPSLCLRYGFAKPSVWLCRKACKLRQFNGFGSDYPLTLSCFGLPYWSVLEHLHVPWFFVALPGTVCSLHEVSRSWLRSPAHIAGSWNDLARGPQIRNHWRLSPSRGRPLGTPFPSEHAGRVLSPPHLWRVAARECWLNPHRKCWLKPNTVVPSTGAQLCHPSRSICTRDALTRATGNNTSGELRDPTLATRNDATSIVDNARVCSRCRPACWCHRPQVRKDRKEPIMHQSRGAVSFTPLFTTDDIGLRKDASVEHVVKVFLNVGEAMAARWIEMPRGILLLQAVPDQPASGAIYLYDRERRIFFFVDFVDGRDDTLTATEFDQLVADYDLVSCAANPAFLSAGTGNTAMA